MTKSVQLKLSKIKYIGDSIGDDIRVDIEVLGKFLRVDKNIRAGTTVEINQEIGRFETDRGAFYADVSITVLEKDLLFNDVGSTKGGVKINTGIINSQQFVFEVQVRETRSMLEGFRGKASAVFEVILVAEVSDAIRYVQDEGDGWLKAILKGQRAEVALPAYLKVKIERADVKREYFTILEGSYRGKSASVALRDGGSSWLIYGIKHEQMVRATYSISRKTFILNGRKYKTVDYPKAPWGKGLYDIEIADYPHEGGRNYLDQSKRAMTWFRIGHDGERYLHTGARSLGCITVIETRRWTEIYNVLIKARKGDLMSVSVLEVID